VRVDGNEIGVAFLARGKSAKKAKQRSGDRAE